MTEKDGWHQHWVDRGAEILFAPAPGVLRWRAHAAHAMGRQTHSRRFVARGRTDQICGDESDRRWSVALHARASALAMQAPRPSPRGGACFAAPAPCARTRPRRTCARPRRARACADSTPQHPLFASAEYRAAFLHARWGRRPTLLRNLLPGFRSPLTPDELAGLACEAGAAARLVTGAHPGPFALKLGPFEPATFAALPSADWTLLLSDADACVPALAALRARFDFLPNWRVDDVMVSYAVSGGSVGPHVDNYDVILVQGAGLRRWRTASTPVAPEDEVLADGDVRVLRDGFEHDEEWVLAPGDALYVPPRFPHYGVALDDKCMTFSVGFRAPAVADLMHGWTEDIVARHALRDVFLKDSIENLVRHDGDAGRISGHAVESAFDQVLRQLQDGEDARERFAHWFAAEVSRPKRLLTDELGAAVSEEEAEKCMHRVLEGDLEYSVLRQQEGSVFTYWAGVDGVSMYIDGERWDVPSVEVASAVCGKRFLDSQLLRRLADKEEMIPVLLKQLFTAGLLYIDDGDFEEADCEVVDTKDGNDVRTQ